MQRLIILGMIACLVACNRYEPDFPPPPEPEAVSALKITVRHLYQTTPVMMDSLVANVSAELYRTADDRADRINRYDLRITDSAGVAFFGKVPDGTWYLVADGKGIGIKEETVVLQGGALELLDIRLP